MNEAEAVNEHPSIRVRIPIYIHLSLLILIIILAFLFALIWQKEERFKQIQSQFRAVLEVQRNQEGRLSLFQEKMSGFNGLESMLRRFQDIKRNEERLRPYLNNLANLEQEAQFLPKIAERAMYQSKSTRLAQVSKPVFTNIEEPSTWYTRFLARLRDLGLSGLKNLESQLSRVFILRHQKEPIHVLPLPQEQHYWVLNLRTDLALARWALSVQNAPSYHQALNHLEQSVFQCCVWIDPAHSSWEVQNFLAQVSQLQKLSFDAQELTQ